MLLWEDPRAVISWNAAVEFIHQYRTLDERNAAFQHLSRGEFQLGGTTLAEAVKMDEFTSSLGREFAAMTSAQLFRSTAEADRHLAAFGRRRQEWEIVVAPSELPNVEWRRPRKPCVVIWAPQWLAIQTSFLAFALEELHCAVWVVCAGGDPPPVRADYMKSDDPRVAELLRGASCVVDASLSDPAAAIAFASRGFPLVVSSTSGAAEFITQAGVFPPWDARSVFGAVVQTAGRPSRVRSATKFMPPGLCPSGVDWSRRSTPMVSVVIPTYNRPAELRSQLQSLSRQTYPNIQIVIVNDGGTPVAEVCDAFPALNIKLLERTENVGAVPAINVGLQATDGTYIACVADDDRFFPDHFARLVDVLEGSGAQAAHANTLMSYAEPGPGGELFEYGWNASVMSTFLDPTWVLASPYIAAMSTLVHRDLYERAGFWWDEKTDVADYEIYLRLSKHADILHVDQFTCECRLRADDAGIGRKLGGDAGRGAIEYVFERHPIEGRRPLETVRRQILAQVGARGVGDKYPTPPTFHFTEAEAHRQPRRD